LISAALRSVMSVTAPTNSRLPNASCKNVGQGMDVLDLPVRQQQAIGMFEICRSGKGAIDDLFEAGAVLGMDALHH